MKPLLNIRSIPMTIEHKATRAALRVQSTQPSVNITRQQGGMNIRSNLAKVNIDSYETRASMGLKTTPRVIAENAEEGTQAAHEAARAITEEGNSYIANPRGRSSTIPDLAMSKSVKQYETVLTFMPSVKPSMSMEGGTIEFNYTMDKLNFDWNINNRPFLEYVPPVVEFNVTQYNEVIIEYVGDPIYVPPSANPNYIPPPGVDVHA